MCQILNNAKNRHSSNAAGAVSVDEEASPIDIQTGREKQGSNTVRE